MVTYTRNKHPIPISHVSSGILLYRLRKGRVEVLLVHPGGPLWVNKLFGTWSIPKGLVEEGENSLEAARREFHEETGFIATEPFLPLTPVRLKSGKIVQSWASEGNCDPVKLKSNTFKMEWPPHSGKYCEFPEVDQGSWFTLKQAMERITKGQLGLLYELQGLLVKRQSR